MNTNSESKTVHTGMGTEMTHQAYGKNAEESLRAVADEAKRLEEIFSRYISESEIGKVNQYAGLTCQRLSPETYCVLSRAAEFSDISHGLFDFTIGPLVDLWNYKNAAVVPDNSRIRRALALVNYRELVLNYQEKTAMLQKSGQSIDLGGIAKGYASDRFMDIFRENGVPSAYSNIGGNVSTLGNKPDGSPWRVGIRHPRRDACLLGAIEVTGKAIVTSGDYERYFFDKEGKRRHHILNPVTGYPAESGLVSVTVIANSAMTADALSTILFVAGMEYGLEILEKYPQTEAVLVDQRLQVYITRGLQRSFQTTTGVKAKLI